MKRKIDLTAFLIIALLEILGCRQNAQEPAEKMQNDQITLSEPSAAPRPPAPPVFETFDGDPQLSLFARLGDYRPEEDDEVTLPYWKTYQEHLVRTAGVVVADERGNRAYSFRSIKGIDSVGFFSPLEVTPNTRYQVNFDARGELPEGASAGVGVLEYDRFLWVAEQFPQSLDEKHRTGQHDGVIFNGTHDWTPYSFTFTTGPKTLMIHLVLHRDGQDSRQSVIFDDIRIEPAQP